MSAQGSAAHAIALMVCCFVVRCYWGEKSLTITLMRCSGLYMTPIVFEASIWKLTTTKTVYGGKWHIYVDNQRINEDLTQMEHLLLHP